MGPILLQQTEQAFCSVDLWDQPTASLKDGLGCKTQEECFKRWDYICQHTQKSIYCFEAIICVNQNKKELTT